MVNEASSSSLTCAFTRYHCSIQSMQTAAANCPTVLVRIRPSEKQRSSPESGKGLAQAPSHFKQYHAQVVLWETDGIREIREKSCGESRGAKRQVKLHWQS